MILRRPGFPLLRGALIGGLGYAAGRRVAAGARREDRQESDIADLQAQRQLQSPPPQPVQPQPVQAPAPGSGADIADRLTELGAMVTRGLLSPDEFATAKAKLLAD